MKLNPDCIRDILLFVEEYVNNSPILVTKINYTKFNHISKYTYDELDYHVHQVGMSGFLSSYENNIHEANLIYMLSPAGHEFLENIRVEKNWSETKKVAANVGSSSLNILKEIAANVISSALTAYLLK